MMSWQRSVKKCVHVCVCRRCGGGETARAAGVGTELRRTRGCGGGSRSGSGGDFDGSSC